MNQVLICYDGRVCAFHDSFLWSGMLHHNTYDRTGGASNLSTVSILLFGDSLDRYMVTDCRDLAAQHGISPKQEAEVSHHFGQVLLPRVELVSVTKAVSRVSFHSLQIHGKIVMRCRYSSLYLAYMMNHHIILI